MEIKKISLDIDAELYTKIKHDVFNQRTTMAKAIREVLNKKYCIANKEEIVKQ